ncbi:MAG TPA: 50S ribosomal protein L29 [Gemmatimonadetes bacterium]|jgi:large subunit ribosomal protein L29|nr:50S ribosomal protein L29 [Gemmatimonadota bacterium]MEC7739256.1 50S ribosomal protein L29 [Gemmatimonadota bacterium]HIC63339.1 50S ribosomal protein L29 [Gemmatimonadota bacterium]|tara:strand:- start:3199 stop:3423 length:225 start_codon:yes stop_codon:yes gene_type:complete
MKAEEIRDWDEVEIEARLKELREEQFKLRFQLSMMELENPNLYRQVRRDIARLETVKKERELTATESNHIPEEA